MQTQISEKQTALDSIKHLLENKQGVKEIYGFTTKIAPSGMSRRIRFFVSSNDSIYDITYSVAKLLDYKHNSDGILRTGVGLDLVYDTIYYISKEIYGSGSVIQKRSL